jgi:hypothetical protein
VSHQHRCYQSLKGLKGPKGILANDIADSSDYVFAATPSTLPIAVTLLLLLPPSTLPIVAILPLLLKYM